MFNQLDVYLMKEEFQFLSLQYRKHWDVLVSFSQSSHSFYLFNQLYPVIYNQI